MSRVQLLLCLLLCAPIVRADTELLPEPSLRLDAARYDPVAPDLHWDTWIGAGTGLVRVRNATLAFRADVETTAGNTRRAFDATQANYHLEPSLSFGLPRERTLGVFYHHVSRHEIDRQKEAAVDWNVLGVRASGRLPGVPRGRMTFTAGHTTLASLIGYRWELTGRIEADPLVRPWGSAYAIAYARGVTAETSPAFPRDGFVDLRLEGGVRLAKDDRTLQVYAAYEHRNDVLILEPGYKDRALLGLRLALRSATPGP